MRRPLSGHGGMALVPCLTVSHVIYLQTGQVQPSVATGVRIPRQSRIGAKIKIDWLNRFVIPGFYDPRITCQS
jgi:hypothetical protein